MAKKIIVIEDEQMIRDIYQKELQKNGYEVAGFASGEEGLAAIKKDKFDVVLLDIMLPGINGLEVLRQIKADETTKKLTVILLTNLGQDDVIKQGFDLGAAGYLIKSNYNPDQIINEVKDLIDGAPSA